jgi:hypothetical protein
VVGRVACSFPSGIAGQSGKSVPQGLKPSIAVAETARLKPCPSLAVFFRGWFGRREGLLVWSIGEGGKVLWEEHGFSRATVHSVQGWLELHSLPSGIAGQSGKSVPQGLYSLRKNSAQVPKGRPRVRAAQISEMIDSVGLILLDKRVLRPGIAKSGWG